MTIQTVIKENAYFDSVTLMTISTRANELAGVKNCNDWDGNRHES